MFKKSLIAVAIAGTAFGANAGSIFSSSTDAVAGDLPALLTVTSTAGEALGADGAIAGGDDNCDVLATDLGVTLGNTGNGEGGDNDTITYTAGTQTNTTVDMTGAGACSVTLASTGSTTALISPVEQTAGNVTIGAVVYPGLGGFREEDTITLNFTGANIDTVNTVAPTLTTSGAGTFDLLDITDTTIRFTVRSGGGDIANTEVVTLGGIVLDSTGLSGSSNVNLNYFATNTSGTDYDVTAGVTVHQFAPQYSASVTTALDGIVDVQNDRLSLALNTADNFGGQLVDDDTLVLGVSLDTTANPITPAQVSIVLGGDFSWLDTAADASDDATAATAAEILAFLNAEAPVAAFYAGGTDDVISSVSLNEDLNELTILATVNGGAVDAAHTIYLGVDSDATGAPVLPEQAYTVSATVLDGTAAPNTINMVAAADAAAGAWTLNGSVLEVPYVPFGPVTQPIIRHTNTGSQTGDITLRYMVEGVHMTWQDGGVLVSDATPGVRNLLSETTSALAAAGYDAATTGFKVALEYTTNVPTGDVALTVGAKFSNQVDTDRLTIGIIE